MEPITMIVVGVWMLAVHCAVAALAHNEMLPDGVVWGWLGIVISLMFASTCLVK
jgi:hypothetical protein